jgi:hypothetical protein
MRYFIRKLLLFYALAMCLIRGGGGVLFAGEIPMLGDIVTTQFDYSTDEQWTGRRWIDGKKIYRKTVDCGALPMSGFKEIAHGIINIDRVYRIEGIAYLGDLAIPFPAVYPNSGQESNIGCDATLTNIRFVVGTNRSNITTSFVTVFYTCTDR